MFDTDKWLKEIDENWNKIKERDQLSKENGELKGRYISEPYADGHAVYEIYKVNKKSVRVRVCRDIGDDWVLPYWGEETTLPMDYALTKVVQRDKMDEFFNKMKNKQS